MIKSRLRVLLAENAMTQKELAEKTGIQPNTISKIYNNDIVRVPIDAMDAICELFDCDVCDLFQYEKKNKS